MLVSIDKFVAAAPGPRARASAAAAVFSSKVIINKDVLLLPHVEAYNALTLHNQSLT